MRDRLPSRAFRFAMVWLAAGLTSVTLAPGSQARDRKPRLARGIEEGTRLEVKGRPGPRGYFVAEKIEVKHEGDDDLELRGLLDAVDAEAGVLRLLGFTVVTDGETRVEREPRQPATLQDLRPGLRVKVDGTVREDGAFVAEKIRIRKNQAYRERKLVGFLEAVEPGPPGYLVFRMLGREILVGEATELETPSGSSRRVVLGRLGVVDDDDLLFTGRGRLGRRFSLAGEVRLRAEVFEDADLDVDASDRLVMPELFGIVGLAADLGPVFVYADVVGEREFIVESPDPFEEGGNDVRIGEAYIRFMRLPFPWLTVAVGRQKFDEEREWFYNKKNLDAVRLVADLAPFSVEASVSRNLFDQTRNLRDQERTNLIVRAAYAPHEDLQFAAYLVDRRDRTEREDSPRILGLRVLGEPGRYAAFWLDAALERGRRGVFDSGSGRFFVRPVRAHAADAGLTLRPRWKGDPTFTLSYAVGSGDDPQSAALDPEEQEGLPDGTFRQSGFHRNRGKFNGVVSFRYYGEVLDPELTNLRIFTAGIGLRPGGVLSVDLLYHRYRQDQLSDDLRRTDLEADPLGLDTDLGSEVDLILGYEPSRRFELRWTAGLFSPGKAFGAETDEAKVTRFQVKFRF